MNIHKKYFLSALPRALLNYRETIGIEKTLTVNKQAVFQSLGSKYG